MKENGHIEACPHQNCGFRCCEFQQGNYILLYPGEINNAQSSNKNIGHLEIIDEDYFGGKKVICKASDTSTCDNGYKPVDCASYPFFPYLEPQDEIWDQGKFIRGIKCPLTISHLRKHAQFVHSMWQSIIADQPNVLEWLKKVKMIGYSIVSKDNERPSAN